MMRSFSEWLLISGCAALFGLAPAQAKTQGRATVPPGTLISTHKVMVSFSNQKILANLLARPDFKVALRKVAANPYDLRASDLARLGLTLDDLENVKVPAAMLSDLKKDKGKSEKLSAAGMGAWISFGQLKACGWSLDSLTAMRLRTPNLAALGESLYWNHRLSGPDKYPGAAAKMAGIPENQMRIMELDSLLSYRNSNYAAWRKQFALGNLDDTVWLDLGGIESLVLRGDSLFILRNASEWAGFWIDAPTPIAQRLLEILPMPFVRIGGGYPKGVLGQAGLVFGPGGDDGRFGLLTAVEATTSGYILQSGFSLLLLSDRHYPSAFVTLGVASHQRWSNTGPWHTGPLLQLGIANVGLEGMLWSGSERGGSISLLMQLFPWGL